MKILRSLLALSMFLSSASLFAQVEEPVNPAQDEQKEKASFADRLVFGGDIGLSFGTITYIKLAPVVGYKLTDRFTAGLGPIYIYERYKIYDLETSTYGGKVVTSFAIYRGSETGNSMGIGDVVLHAENEVINVEPLYYYSQLNEYAFGHRIWIDNLLVGGGLMQTIAGRFSVSMFILWDITQNEFSPYNNPIFKFGFNF